MFMALRQWWGRLLEWRAQLHDEADRMGIDPSRYQPLRPPGDEMEPVDECLTTLYRDPK